MILIVMMTVTISVNARDLCGELFYIFIESEYMNMI